MVSPKCYDRLAGALKISTSTPVKTIDDHCLIIRDDRTHPIIGGNKWRKLVGFLSNWDRQNHRGIVSFGGAYSNHLHACAWICQILDLPFTAVVKGFPSYLDNPTMRDIREWNARIELRSPARYEQLKDDRRYWMETFPNWLIVPEGGRGKDGQCGYAFLSDELERDIPDNATMVIASGTGTSAAGMTRYLSNGYNFDIWPVVSREEVALQVNRQNESSRINIRKIETGSFADWDGARLQWILDWWNQTGILLDPVYTAPVFYEALKEYKNQVLVLYHSGGLQGWRGYLDRYADKISSRDRRLVLDGIRFGSG